MIAQALVENGAKVYISSRSAETLRRTADRLSSLGPGHCIALPQDLADEAGCKAAAEALSSREESLNILVNNSGISWGAKFEEFPEKQWARILALNVTVPFLLTRALRPLLDKGCKPSDPARVINIGSVAGLHPQPIPTYSYDVSKAGVHMLTRKLAAELAPRITVNAIAPGYVPSRMSRGLLSYAPEERLASSVPMGRFGSAADIGGAALYLSSPAGAWVTGTILTVDGGHTGASTLRLGGLEEEFGRSGGHSDIGSGSSSGGSSNVGGGATS